MKKRALFGIIALMLVLCMSFFASCATPETSVYESSPDTAETVPSPQPSDENKPDEYGSYHKVEEVVLYLHFYGKLPSNFLTKSEARELGWSGSGAVGSYKPDGAIGGDVFQNRERLLPQDTTYTECDIDTYGGARGAKRLVFSADGHYYYTSDHYRSFTELTVNEKNEVVWK